MGIIFISVQLPNGLFSHHCPTANIERKKTGRSQTYIPSLPPLYFKKKGSQASSSKHPRKLPFQSCSRACTRAGTTSHDPALRGYWRDIGAVARYVNIGLSELRGNLQAHIAGGKVIIEIDVDDRMSSDGLLLSIFVLLP